MVDTHIMTQAMSQAEKGATRVAVQVMTISGAEIGLNPKSQ